MLGLFGTLNLGARSLSVEQQASEVTGNNLANVNNPNYSRQRLVIVNSAPLPVPQGQEGTGVDATGIEAIRDNYLNNQIVSQSSITGSLSSQQSALQDAETYLNEQIQNSSAANTPAGSQNGIAATLSSLFDAFQSLSLQPGDLSERQTVVATAQQLANQFNQVSTQLGTLRTNINQSIQSDVDASNQDLKDIAQLNLEIANATAAGGSANELVDQRQQKLEDLASKINFTSSTESNGAVDITIGGVRMVGGSTAGNFLQTYTVGQDVYVQSTTGVPMTGMTGGSINGSIAARDGGMQDLQNGLDSLASNLIDQVNSTYSAGYDLNGNTGQNFFTGTDAASIGVNAALAASPSTFQASGSATAPGDNTVALEMAQLGNKNVGGLNNQTFSQNYATTVSTLGNAIASVTDQLNNSQAVGQMLGNQRLSVSGVNTDEEMTNLLQFQKAYQASAELISTINSMLETVINMKSAG